MDRIYCAGGNPKFYEIAKSYGFLYGARLPDTIYGPLYFADQEWKNPDRDRYMAELDRHRPYMATVLDLERRDQLDEVLSWAEQACQFVQEVIVIPKVFGIVSEIPEQIAGKPVRLGYSVPTKYGGTSLFLSEFGNRPVHALGGSPQAQMTLCSYLNVVSVDGNMHNLMATRFCQFWTPGTARYASNRFWPTLRESNGGVNWEGDNPPMEAFRRSLKTSRGHGTG